MLRVTPRYGSRDQISSGLNFKLFILHTAQPLLYMSCQRTFAKFHSVRRRSLIGHFPCWKLLLVLSYLRIYEDTRLNRCSNMMSKCENWMLVYKNLNQWFYVLLWSLRAIASLLTVYSVLVLFNIVSLKILNCARRRLQRSLDTAKFVKVRCQLYPLQLQQHESAETRRWICLCFVELPSLYTNMQGWKCNQTFYVDKVYFQIIFLAKKTL